MKTTIETVVITPTKEMPKYLFLQLYRTAYFMELMEHLPDGRVIWDDEASSIVSDGMAEAEYLAIQNDWLEVSFELPKKTVDWMLGKSPEPQESLF